MDLASFSYNLPQELIAQTPVEPRDSARLLVYDRESDSIEHARVRDLSNFLPKETLCVANNSKVRRSRHQATHIESGREYELFILEEYGPQNSNSYTCLLRGKAAKVGDTFKITSNEYDLRGVVSSILPNESMTTFVLQFSTGAGSVAEALEQTGEIPLPPYITESSAPDERYQTIYAGPLGSAAAPTAGLHITEQLRNDILHAGHSWAEVTLHVGLGTFLPLRNATVEENTLHTEVTSISDQVAQRISNKLQENGNVLAIGTTSLRTLEGHYGNHTVQAGTQQTNVFLYPGKEVQTANLLLTNFHLPQSSLLVLVATFLAMDPKRTRIRLESKQAVEVTQKIYAEAIRERYRFFSFGDAMLIR